MDSFDILQIEQEQSNKRLMAEDVAIEQARQLNHHTRAFGHDKVTDKQIADEMTYTMMNCSPCEIKETK